MIVNIISHVLSLNYIHHVARSRCGVTIALLCLSDRPLDSDIYVDIVFYLVFVCCCSPSSRPTLDFIGVRNNPLVI